MKSTRINILIECVCSKDLLSKKSKIFFQSQYDYLNNSELFKKMGIVVKKVDHFDNNGDFVVDKNNNLKPYTYDKKENIRNRFMITDFDYLKFKNFKNQSFLKIILNLINNNKLYFISGFLLKNILFLSLYLIMANLTATIDQAFTYSSRYVYEICTIVGFIGVIIFYIIFVIYNLINRLLAKKILNNRNIYIEDELRLDERNQNLNMQNTMCLFCKNIIDLLSLGIIFFILYFFGNSVLKFYILQLIMVIVLCQLYIESLKLIGIYNYLKKKREKINNIMNDEFIQRYKIKEKLCLNVFKFIYITLFFEIYLYLSYKIFSDTLSIGLLLFNYIFIMFLIYPFYNILCNVPNYIELIIFLRESKEINKEQSDKKTIIFIKPPNICLKNISYSYNENIILNDVFLDIKSSAIIEIFGNSESGKKILINLIMKKVISKDGDVLIDGINIKNLNDEILSQLFEYINFNYDFLGLSIKQYFLMNNSYSQNDFDYILKKLDFLDYLKKYPDFIETKIIDKFTLSNSEVVLLLLGKAIFNDKKIIILDNLLNYLNDIQISNVMNILEDLGVTIIILEKYYKEHNKVQKYYELNNGKLKEKYR